MVEFEVPTDSSSSDLCHRIMSNFHTELKEMMSMQKERWKEHSIAIGFDGGDMVASDIGVGDVGSIRMVDELNLISSLPNGYKKVLIHTHPIGEGYHNMIFSPRDIDTMVRHMEETGRYAGSMVLTENNGSLTLYGIHVKDIPRGLGDIQDDIAEKERRIELLSGNGMSRLYLTELGKLQDIAKDMGEPCRVTEEEIK